jgi:hypothetical protein
MLKNTQLKTEIDYDKNLEQLLGWAKPELSVLERSYGLIKGNGKTKISPVAYQRKTRKEWEKRMERQYK